MYKASRRYGLQGTDAMVFEALVWLSRQSKDGTVKISYSKLAEFSLCGGRMTAARSMQRLIACGLVAQNEQGYAQIVHESAQNETISKEERTKEENININKSLSVKKTDGRTDFSLDFLEFWKAFNVAQQHNNRKAACYKIWQTMPNDWKARARECAACHLPDANPYFWLQDEVYLRVDPNAQVATEPDSKAAPSWLDHEQQYQLLQGGAELMFCRRPEGKGFGTVTQADAERFGLEVVRKVKL